MKLSQSETFKQNQLAPTEWSLLFPTSITDLTIVILLNNVDQKYPESLMEIGKARPVEIKSLQQGGD